MPNPFLPFLEDSPEILYRASLPQQGRSRTFLDYFLNRYGNIYGDYMGDVGSRALRGEDPNLKFSDYIGNYDWDTEYARTTPQQRGERSRGGARWITPLV